MNSQIINQDNMYICSVCGQSHVGSDLNDQTGHRNIDNNKNKYCFFCHNLMLDTGIRDSEYLAKRNTYPDYEQSIFEKIVIPYGKFDPEVQKETKRKIERNLRQPSLADLQGKNSVSCPYCKSGSVRKISTASRLLSTGLFGLASKKIGKQWHCGSCGSDF